MNFRKTRLTSRVAVMFAAAAAVVLVPGFAGAAYTWSGASPTDGGKLDKDTSTALAATVSWEEGDKPLFNGTVTATAAGYTGQMTYGYSYSGQNQSPGSGSFKGVGGIQDTGSLTFNPALNSGTSVSITYTASTTTGLPPTTTQSSTTVTATAP